MSNVNQPIITLIHGHGTKFLCSHVKMCTEIIIITFITGKNDLSGESLNIGFTSDLVAPI